MSIRHVALAAVVAALVVAPASAASAIAIDDPQPISFSTTAQTVMVGQPITATLQLGDWWSDDCIGTAQTGQTCVSEKTLHVTLDGDEVVTKRAIDAKTIDLSIYNATSTLHAGTHQLQAACDFPFTCSTTVPLTITATPAPLTVDGRVETDEAHPSGAVVSALLSGDVLDQYLGCGCSLDPAGTWNIAIVDASGATVAEHQIAVARGAQKDVSFYWNDVPRGAQFTATFAFTPTGSHASDLSVTGDSIPYSSPVAGIPSDNSTPDPSVQTTPTVIVHPSTLPAWAIVTAGVLALAVIIAIAVLVIRLARGPVLFVRREALERPEPGSDG